MKENSSDHKETRNKSNANQTFYQKKTKQESFSTSRDSGDSAFRSSTHLTPPPLNFNSASIQRKKNNNLPLDFQANIDNSFGQDFSNVRIHKNSQEATELNARAFTQGNNIHFAPNEFDPDSDKGRRLIGHEFTHVVQQAEGRVKPTTQENGMSINDDKNLEKEADEMGSKMLQFKSNSQTIEKTQNNTYPSQNINGQANQGNIQKKLNGDGTVLQKAKCYGENGSGPSGIELSPEAEKYLNDIIKIAEQTPSFWEIACPNIKLIDAKSYKGDEHTEWAEIDESRETTINLNTHVTEGGFFFRDPTATYGTILHEAMHGMGPIDQSRKHELASHTDMTWRKGLDQIVEGMREFDIASKKQHSYAWYYAIASRGIPDERTRISGTAFGKIASKIRKNEDRYEEYLKGNELLKSGKSTYSVAHAKFLMVDWELFRSTRKMSSPAEKLKIMKQLETSKKFE